MEHTADQSVEKAVEWAEKALNEGFFKKDIRSNDALKYAGDREKKAHQEFMAFLQSDDFKALDD